jgi:hypothetical protein
MRNSYLFKNSYLYPATLLSAVLFGLFSCTKSVSGTDNNQVVETPYSIIFSDTSGAVYKSNDGKTFTNIFVADGTPCRAICSQNGNIFIIKNNLYVSSNNGANFSVGNNFVASVTCPDIFGNVTGLNESMIINIPDWYRTYVVSSDPSGANFFGQSLSISGGVYGSWGDYEAVWDTFPGGIGIYLPIQFISYTRLKNGVLCALGLDAPVPADYRNYIYRNFYKIDTPNRDPWMEVTAGANGASRNMSGTPLPGSSFFTLGHYNNRLIAIDGRGQDGAYYSDDTGRTWVQYPGIPTNLPLLSVCSPFDQTSLIGTSNGLYQLNNSTGAFQLNNNGLTNGIRVAGIAYKENVFKSGSTKQFVYLATNKGIYQSQDGGNTWVMTIPGNFTTIY